MDNIEKNKKYIFKDKDNLFKIRRGKWFKEQGYNLVKSDSSKFYIINKDNTVIGEVIDVVTITEATDVIAI